MARHLRNKSVSLGAVLAVLLIVSNALNVSGKRQVGINLGLMGDSLPDVTRTVDLLDNVHAGAVRLYDANPEILNALSNRPHDVIVSVRNDQLAAIATSPHAADAWVQTSVTPFYPATKITFIAVGNEVLLAGNVEVDGQYVIQALKNIHRALESRNLHHAIKVISPLSGEVLRSSWPPAAGFFTDLQYVLPLLYFLEETRSTFFINLYPYYAHITNIAGVPLDFASFERNSSFYIDPFSNKTYSNLFESMLDAAYNAMATLGFPDLPLAVGETGWPTAGGHAATIRNAELFNKNLIQHVYNKGTPQRPDVRTTVFLFALYDENQKPGPEYERHWGLLHADGTPAYSIDLADPTVVLDAPTSPFSAATPADGSAVNPVEVPSEAVDAPSLPLPAASPFDGAPVNPWVSVIVPPASAPVNPWISVIAPPAALDAPSWPLAAGAPVDADGTPVSPIDLPYFSTLPDGPPDGPFLPALPPAAPAHSTSEDPIDFTELNEVPDGPFLPLAAGASADGSLADPIDVADHSEVLDAPTLPYTAIASTDGTTVVPSIDVSDRSVVMNAPTLPYTATATLPYTAAAPTDGTAVDSNDLADRSVALDAPFLPLPATFPGV